MPVMHKTYWSYKESIMSRRFSRSLAAAVMSAACLFGVLAPATADAAPNGNVVTFGDSYTSNPDEKRNALKKSQIPQIQEFVWGNYPSNGGCLQAPDNWPRQMARMKNVPVDDYSCTAQTSATVNDSIDRAIRDGAIHRGTRAVVIAVGINEYGPYGISQGQNPFDQPRVQQTYVNNMKRAVGKVRRAAPNAKVIIPGMLSVSEPTGWQAVCVLNVIPNAPFGFPLPPLQQLELWTRDNQRAAAHATGSTFVEIKDASRHNHTCSPDAQRFVGAGIDTTVKGHHMGFHPSYHGSRFMAEMIGRHI